MYDKEQLDNERKSDNRVSRTAEIPTATAAEERRATAQDEHDEWEPERQPHVQHFYQYHWQSF